MGDKILVTGADRSVGNEVIAQLGARGAYVRAAVTDLDRARAMDWHGVEIVPFDYADPATYPAMCDGMDRLLLVMPPGETETHAETLPNLIDVARDSGVSHIVFISSVGTENIYLSSQWVVEQHLQRGDCPYTILRSGWFFQNYCDSPEIRDGIMAGRLEAPLGEARISGVDVRDVAAVAARALTESNHHDRIYVLGEHAMNGHEIAATFSSALGRPVEYRPLDEYTWASRMRATGAPRQEVKWWRIVYQLMRQGAYEYHIPDISRVLGRPSITLKQYVLAHVDCWTPSGG